MTNHASMNRIYRLVWNAALNVWVAVAENAKGAGKGGSSRSRVGFTSTTSQGFGLNAACGAALVMLAVLLAPEAHAANAADAVVSSGAGSVATTGATTTITQASQRLAIDWSQLSTTAHEALVFNQPNAQAIALNRITGSSPSEFLGSLTANGQVFILNPNGVLFGAGSQVNVGGLVASTLSMSNADFMAGNHVFSNNGASGSVVNQGSLNAAPGGYLALLAPEVRNEGVMTASLGTALLAAGNKITLTLDNGSLLGYSIDQGAIKALAENKHLIQANGGQVLLSASAMDSLTTATVNNTGIIEAKTLQNKAGRILLMGDMETGTVNVGGTLDASAPDGGDGGFIETSAAHISVAKDARITTLAAQGKTGTWLLDPVSMTIAGGTGAAVDTIYEDTLEAASSNVVIEATDTITASGTFGGSDVTLQSGVNLTIRTTGPSGGTGIDLTSSTHGAALAFKTSGGGSIHMSTGNTSQLLKASTLSVADSGSITLAPVGALDVTGTTVQTAGGAITLLGSAVKVAASTVDAGGGDISITGAGASATHSVEITDVGATRSNVTTTGAGKITLSGSLSSGGASATGGSAGGVVITNSSITTGTGAISITGHAGGVATGGQIERGFRLDSGTLITSAGDISLTGTVSGNQPMLPDPYFGPPYTTGGELANGASVSSTGGDVTLSGTLTNNRLFHGVGLAVDGKVQSGAGNKVTLTGRANVGTWVSGASNIGGVGTGLSTGVLAEIVAGTGGLTITGTVDAPGPSTNLNGVRLDGAISSTGNIAVTGVSNATAAAGVTALNLVGGTLTGLGSATITLKGSGVPAPAPASFSDVSVSGTTVSTAGGQISLTGDRVRIDSTIHSGSGRTVITTSTASRGITLGGGPGSEQNGLNLSSAEINRITASVLQLGGATHTGGISIGDGGPITMRPTLALGLVTTGDINQTAGLNVGKLNAVGRTVTLTNASNQIDELSGRSTAGAFQVSSSKSAPLTVGTVDGTAGINSGANATVLANLNGAIAHTQAITAGSLNASAQDGITLSTNVSGTQMLTTTGAAGDISITTANAIDTSNFNITTGAASAQTVSLSSGAGITVGGTFGNSQDKLRLMATGGNIAINGALTASELTLSTDGTSSQTAAITATGLELLGSGTHTLNHASNAVGTLAGNTGNVDYSQAGALAIGTVNTAGLTTSGKVLVRVTGAAGDITLNNTVTSGSAASDSLVLAAGRNFINNAGATPLNPGAGRFLVYSTDPTANTFGGFASTGNAFSRSYAANAPSDASMTSLTGNRMVYSVTPMINITGDNQTKVYGAADPALSYTVNSGLVAGDTAGSVLAGLLAGPTGSAASAGTHAIMQGTLAAALGYGIAYTDGTLTVDKATLTVTGLAANNKTYDGSAAAALSNMGTLTGLAYGETLVLGATGAFDDANAGIGKTVTATYSLADGAGGLAGNYQLAAGPVTTTADIAKANLNVTANNDHRVPDGAPYAGGNGVSYSGFAVGETAAVLGGSLSYGGSSQGASAAGSYAIMPGGYSAGNYTLNYFDGVLTIGLPVAVPAPVLVTGAAPAGVTGGAPAGDAYASALQAMGGVGASLGGGGAGAGSSGDAGALAAAAAVAGDTGEDE